MDRKTFLRGIAVQACLLCCSLGFAIPSVAEPIIVDHTCTDITALPEAAIVQAKQQLHIAYGHTSHGSQLTTGMAGLVAFANGGGLGLALAENIFAWNNGGIDGALDLHDEAMGGDVGYWPSWYNNTVAYLDNPANADVNVIIWSWCGQVDDKYSAGTLQSEYLDPMSNLEALYPNVRFVYMTGHVDIWDDADNKAANQMIRDYVIANDKILYDFNDIEHFDPDGNYYEYVHDNCNYYDGPLNGGTLLGNWATEWQGTHVEGEDWYTCTSAHSQPLNANLKAYAAWYLWARLGGWSPESPAAGVIINETDESTFVAEGGETDSYTVVLNSQPSGDVVITITPDEQLDIGQGDGAPAELTFTADNWDVPQTVVVLAVDDRLYEGPHSVTITHLVASDDPNYADIVLQPLTVSITDNDSRSWMSIGGILQLLISDVQESE